MRKLWKNYSYVIIFISLSILLTFIWANHPTTNADEYVTITINEGDTLWSIGEKFAEEHGLTIDEFINWVKRTNQIDVMIYVGETIVIPIKKNDVFIASIQTNHTED